MEMFQYFLVLLYVASRVLKIRQLIAEKFEECKLKCVLWREGSGALFHPLSLRAPAE